MHCESVPKRCQPLHLLAAALLVVAGCRQPSEPSAVTAEGDRARRQPKQLAAATASDASADLAFIRRTDPAVANSPDADGWRTEHLAELAQQRLKELGNTLLHGTTPSGSAIDNCECRFPQRAGQQPDYADGVISVYRWSHSDNGSSKSMDHFIRDWRSHFTKPLRVETKVVDVRLHADNMTTRVIVEAVGLRGKDHLQQTCTWRCEWKVVSGNDGEHVQFHTLDVEDQEEVAHAGTSSRLSDVTEFVFRRDVRYSAQLAQGTDDWTKRIPAALGLSPWGDCGLAIGDVNGDHLDDVYLCQPGGLPNLLYFHQPDGSVQLAGPEHNAAWLDDTRAALLHDLDNDGDQDLSLSMRTALVLMENDGQGHFRLRGEFPAGRDAFSLASADYDNDGHLDIYACRYYSDQVPDETDRTRFSAPLPYHNATNGPPNLLLRNLGNWEFREANHDTGLGAGNNRWSYAAAWEDFDNDGDQDLYVANDFGPNNFYRNDGGTFVDVAEAFGVLDASTGMSVDWEDYDRDARPDLYVGNMYSAAGQRVMAQSGFKPTEDNSLRDRYRFLARGNSLLRNRGAEPFEDVSESANVFMGRWAWSSIFVDLNNDGWRDIAVGNGYYSGQYKDDL